MADTIKTNLGPVTAYADAKAHGYTGTREEFGQLLANAGLNLKAAEAAKADAEAAKQAAETAQQAAASNASSASTSASTATTQAAAAKSSADAAASSATAAKASEVAAGKSAQGAAASESAAKAAQTAAETAKANADTAASNAAAKATAAANSAAAAKKTLESIPADYSTLSGKVNENTSGIRELNKELPTIQYLIKHDIYDIIVAKDGTGDYATVTEAVENAKDFATIYVKNGTYDNEIVKAWLKTVFIFGESRDGVIIKNNTGEYATPPIEMGTGMLKNLTVYAEGNATPTNKGYALHSESSVEASSCNFFILENCTFKSDYRQSWGMGMRGDVHYYARNCTFERIYFHDCEHAYRATNQYIEFDSCNIVAKADGMALLLQDQQMSGANIDLTFNRCLVKSENGANVRYGKWTGSGVEWVSSLDDFPTWHLSHFSFGNNDNALNA